MRAYWLESLIQSGRQLWELGKLVPNAERRDKEKANGGLVPSCRVALRCRGAPLLLADGHGGDKPGLRLWLVSLWQEVRSIDTLLDEVALEFDGEDPLSPIMRSVLEKARRDLTLLHGAFDKDRWSCRSRARNR